jgi:ATP sulfurylase
MSLFDRLSARVHRKHVASVRERLVEYAKEQGVAADKIDVIVGAATEDRIRAAFKNLPAARAATLGDGTVLHALVDWLKSDDGKAFIKLLFELIIKAVVLV